MVGAGIEAARAKRELRQQTTDLTTALTNPRDRGRFWNDL